MDDYIKLNMKTASNRVEEAMKLARELDPSALDQESVNYRTELILKEYHRQQMEMSFQDFIKSFSNKRFFK